VNTPQTDIAGRVWNGNGPLRGYQDSQSLAKILAVAPEQAAEKGVPAALRRHMRVATIEVVAT
jgi:hypothetical protein